MLTRRRFLSGLVLSSLAQNGFASPSSQSVLKQLQKIDANILLMRHALAPGFGDPNGFDITQCCTQRNLDSRGRKQAAPRGQDFRNSGVKFDAIYSSQWCRCMETAKLLNMGAVQPFAGLNSFFEEYVRRHLICVAFRHVYLQTRCMKQRSVDAQFDSLFGLNIIANTLP